MERKHLGWKKKPEALRLERAMKRDAASEQQIRDRMAAQMNEEQKRNKSHFVILNDGSSSLDTQLAELLEILKTSKK